MKSHSPPNTNLVLVALLLAWLSGVPAALAAGLTDQHPGLLSLRGVPSGSEDWSFAPFADQGAWFGFAVPPNEEPRWRGGFTGPFLMPAGRWLGPQLAGLELTDAASDEVLPWTEATGDPAAAFPGSLRRDLEVGGLTVRQRLWFTSARTAVLQVWIDNPGDEHRLLQLAWRGTVFPEAALAPTRDGVLATAADRAVVVVTPDRPVEKTTVTDHAYRMDLLGPLVVPAGDSHGVVLALTHTVAGDPIPAARFYPSEARASWRKNEERWNRYLKAVDTGRPADHPDQIVAVKSLQTLVNNWRAPVGRLRWSALFPSSNVGYFNGFWAWDSWKHAVGLLEFDPELAKDQVRAMFDHQDERGMIADVVYLDPGEDNWRDTKPPLAGWAIEAVFERTGDLDFVRELYPRLVAYHAFWSAHRDHDGDGLCEYGSTDGTLVAARWESGMDNAVRFDAAGMLENGPGAWSMDQESVDLNAYLYREKVALAVLAKALGRDEEAARWRAEAARLKARIQAAMFDEDTGWFYDIGIATEQFVPVQGPEGWIPLWAGVATEAQADRVRATMLDPAKFNTHVPFPTVAADHPEFSEGYWRGLVWLDQAYFAIEGLRNYGYTKDADELVHRLLRNLEGAAIPGAPLRENYYPVTGAGRNVRHFSWTAAHLLLLTRPSIPSD